MRKGKRKALIEQKNKDYQLTRTSLDTHTVYVTQKPFVVSKKCIYVNVFRFYDALCVSLVHKHVCKWSQWDIKLKAKSNALEQYAESRE